jgi:hypothetical protein
LERRTDRRQISIALTTLDCGRLWLLGRARGKNHRKIVYVALVCQQDWHLDVYSVRLLFRRLRHGMCVGLWACKTLLCSPRLMLIDAHFEVPGELEKCEWNVEWISGSARLLKAG